MEANKLAADLLREHDFQAAEIHVQTGKTAHLAGKNQRFRVRYRSCQEIIRHRYIHGQRLLPDRFALGLCGTQPKHRQIVRAHE